MAGEEGLWRAHCEAEYSLRALRLPDGGTAGSYRAAYGAWRSEFGRYGELAGRALRAWRLVEDWAAQHFPAVAASLRCNGGGDALAWRSGKSASAMMAGRRAVQHGLGVQYRVNQWRTALPNPCCPGSKPPPCSRGASEAELDAAERQLGFALPPALRVLYRVHNGQELEFDRLVGAAATQAG